MNANGRWELTRLLNINPLPWEIWWDPTSASKWKMGINPPFKLL